VVPAMLKVTGRLSSLVVMVFINNHQRAKVCGENKVGFIFAHGLYIVLHALGGCTPIRVHFLRFAEILLLVSRWVNMLFYTQFSTLLWLSSCPSGPGR